MSICEEKHGKSCANENGEWKGDHKYDLSFKMHSIPCEDLIMFC